MQTAKGLQAREGTVKEAMPLGKNLRESIEVRKSKRANACRKHVFQSITLGALRGQKIDFQTLVGYPQGRKSRGGGGSTPRTARKEQAQRSRQQEGGRKKLSPKE
jgi:hypothetical protein